MQPQAINSSAAYSEITDRSVTPVIIYFWAASLALIEDEEGETLNRYTEVANDPKFGGITFYMADASSLPDITEREKVRIVPTYILYREGKRIHGIVGNCLEGLNNFATSAHDAKAPSRTPEDDEVDDQEALVVAQDLALVTPPAICPCGNPSCGRV